jgi:DNA-3-methyladenine glycosylase
VLDVARDLLGRQVRSEVGGVVVRATLVEVEAYRGADDPGSHAFRGPTRRNATMFGPPGHLYVYFTYGMHWCANVVCAAQGTAEAVLLRAAVVVDGAAAAAERRPGSSVRELARGPARLTKALGIDGGLDGADLVAGPVVLLPGEPVAASAVRTGPRVGVAGAGAPTQWRFWVDGAPEVSAYRPAVRRRRPAAGSAGTADG